MNGKGLFSSNSDEWATPQDLFDKLNEEFHFDYDPCATSQNHKCLLWTSKEDDGLTTDWGGAECSVIHHIRRLRNGLKNAIGKHEKTILLLYYSFRQERTQDIFGITFGTGAK